MSTRRTQAARSHATRSALLAAGRRLFADQGYAGTGREQIAEAAGVTRGALYHHFASKEQLFRAVVEELEGELVERVASVAMKVDDPAARLRAGTLAFLDACLEPAMRRIVLLEAPVVLGWDTWREIDGRYGLALVRVGLEEALPSDQLGPGQADVLAHLLLGALNEAALLVATAKRPRRARAEVGATLELLVDRLLLARDR